MKTVPQIVAGGGWRGTRLDRIKKAWIALILAMVFGGVSILFIGSVLFYACIPAVVSLIVSVVLFIREQAIEIESFSGQVGAAGMRVKLSENVPDSWPKERRNVFADVHELAMR